jgi:hypothetical protein
MFLAVALVALNSFFWLAAGGFALPRAVINNLFGERLIRAEVLVQTPTGPADYRIDRGDIVSATPTSITLRELNGEVVTMDVASSARVQGGGRFATVAQLRKRIGTRVTVMRDANGPITLIQIG